MNDRWPTLTEGGGCSECGVGPLELCPPCDEEACRRKNAVATPRRAVWPLWAIKVAIWAVRGLRRILEGRKRP
jgi:hypothetical protein